MSKPQRKSERYFEEIGERFNQWVSPYDEGRRLQMVQRLMPRNALTRTCLEVGCGTGAISKGIAPLVGCLTVADISASLARQVGELLHIAWLEQDACALSIPDESFDLVISSECIEHTPDPRRAIAEMARVVKRGGMLIVTSPNKLWFPLVWLAMKTKTRKFSGNERWLFPWEAQRILRNHGIGHIVMTGCHLLPWQLPFAKKVLPFFDRMGRILYPFMINYGLHGVRMS
jgi:ubiquinone/menaquinone biosynthesis C-methylase UbiE